MNIIQILASAFFVLGYAAIALEHPLKISKSAVALFIGSVLWIMVSISGHPHVTEELMHSGADIFSIVVFLLAAMSMIEILIHYRFFDVIRGQLFALKLNEKQQFLLISLVAFILSAVIDNLTTTIIMIQISRKFFQKDNLLVTVGAIVIAANAGGAFSPIGDVTTIMLWFADKFSALEIIAKGFLPSFILYVVAMAFMYKKIQPSNFDTQSEIITKFGRSEKLVISVTFIAFIFPLLASLIDLPPYIGLLFGLGTVWLIIDIFKRIAPKPTHLEASIEDFIKKIDIPSLKFFIGILLSVSALHALGVLEVLAGLVYGHGVPTESALITGNIGLGLLSSILDNVPLTAIAIQILDTVNSDLWVLLALAVGTGGSLFVVGSAAGVVAMGLVKELTFNKYFKVAFLPALAGFTAGVGTWCVQYFVF